VVISAPMVATPTNVAPLRRWTREEYERMVDAGILGPSDRVELVEGEIVVTSPERGPHAAAIDLGSEALRRIFGAGFTVRVQHPLALGLESEPEPDIAIVRGSPRDYVSGHPSSAVLVVEVSDSSLDYDRATKASLHARAGIAEYWIINLVDPCLEVHRDPRDAAGYQSVTRLDRGSKVSPLAAPHSHVAVDDLIV
jgi:Uma2 family endonuclease